MPMKMTSIAIDMMDGEIIIENGNNQKENELRGFNIDLIKEIYCAKI